MDRRHEPRGNTHVQQHNRHSWDTGIHVQCRSRVTSSHIPDIHEGIKGNEDSDDGEERTLVLKFVCRHSPSFRDEDQKKHKRHASGNVEKFVQGLGDGDSETITDKHRVVDDTHENRDKLEVQHSC